jgi:hypothetical protein
MLGKGLLRQRLGVVNFARYCLKGRDGQAGVSYIHLGAEIAFLVLAPDLTLKSTAR